MTATLRAATLGGVHRPARLAILTLLFAALPGRALAQEESANPPIEEPQYEPDQRGALETEPPGEAQEEEAPLEQTRTEPGSVNISAQADSGYATSSSRFGFELALELGASLTALDSAGQSNLVRETQEGSVGAALGFRAAFRVGPAAIGPRVAMIIDPSFVLANLGIGVHVMLLPDAVAPFVSAALGATIVSALGDPLPAQQNAGIFGLGAELGGGVRWQSHVGLIMGAEVAAGWHHLWRDGAACASECSDGEFDVREPGESDALTLRLSLFAGYSFE